MPRITTTRTTKKKSAKKTVPKKKEDPKRSQRQALIGKKAPSFRLKDQDGNSIALSSFTTPFVLLFFYPRDSTPGCTVEAVNFSKDLKVFDRLGVTIIGISGGDEKSKKKFIEKQKLKVLLVSDSDFSVCSKYGAYGKKSFMGRTFDGIYRVSFLLDAQKKVLHVFDPVKPPLHSKEVQAHVESLR